MSRPVVGIVMGSDSDLPVMRETAAVLQRLDVPFEITVASAHRSPERAAEYARTAAARGLRVIVAAAGGAAHLAGVMAAHTTLPVVGVPLAGPTLGGLDALLSTAQMPPGVPVGTMAIGGWGAQNAGWFAAQVLALSDPALASRLQEHKAAMARAVEDKARRVTEAL
ncbi:MAG: 5-(carboxyamino)imidazole ribonucleotide mutase [Armatimonadota bacterium]|nr:5-(carboxyamino)imidazole ribonucleotide mutase [Armatimonadota bacterium]MDR5697842.1 5-(carboxyamino)imidazole ribonucleotide mutase [Armatimonadota bacterium]